MKTTRYCIFFENIETQMCTQISLTKNEYLKQLAFMREQVKDTVDNEFPVVEYTAKVYESETTIQTCISFNCGCAYTDLIKEDCKPGYCFKK